MYSENGWPIIDALQLDRSTIPGTGIVPVPGTLEGDVGWLLRWVGRQFDRRVAELHNPGCWGWNAPTVIPGSTIYSNHASGTAIDFNAPSFPWQKRTMTPQQRQACRDIIQETEYVVAWGGDFTTIVDEMHFEINGTSEDVARIVKKLKGEDMKPTKDEWQEIHQLAFQGDSASEETLNYLMGLSDLGAGLRWIHGGGTWKDRQREIRQLKDTEVAKTLAKIKSLLN